LGTGEVVDPCGQWWIKKFVTVAHNDHALAPTMRSLIPLTPFLLSLLPTTLALHQSEVGIIDWHKPLIGVPLIGSLATAPVFHRVNAGNGNGSKGEGTKSVVISATGSGVLAAVDPVDGSLGMCRVKYSFFFILFHWLLIFGCSLEICIRALRPHTRI
jgi:hypothetical protein